MVHAVEELVWRIHTSTQHDGSLCIDDGIDLSHFGFIDRMFVAHRHHLKTRANAESAEVGLHDTELHIHLLRRDHSAHDVTHLCQLACVGCDIGHDTVEGGCHAGYLQFMTGRSQFRHRRRGLSRGLSSAHDGPQPVCSEPAASHSSPLLYGARAVARCPYVLGRSLVR